MSILMLAIPLLFAGLLVAVRRAPRSGTFRLPRRLGPFLGGLAIVALVVPMTGGLDGTREATPLFIVLILVPVVGLIFFLVRREQPVAERAWSAPSVAIAGVGTGRANGSAMSSSWSVARALGRVEAHELARSFWFGVGVGFCVLLFVLFGGVFAGEENAETWDEFIQLAPWLAHPLVGMSVLAGHRAVTRPERDGADELFDSCPAHPSVRTAGLLLAGVTPVATLLLFLVGLGTVNAIRSPNLYGPIGGDNLADVLSAVLLGAGGLALGVVLGQWVRFTLLPVAVLVGIALLTARLNGIGDPGWNLLAPLSTAPAMADPAPIFSARPAWWHLLWLTALIAAVVSAAFARDRRDRAVVGLGLVAVTLAVVSAFGATRPMRPGTAERIADLIAHPAAHQDCTAAGDSVRVCTYRSSGELSDRVVDRLRPIAAVLPVGNPTLTMRQLFDGALNDLPPEVRRHLHDGIRAPAAGEVGIGFSASSGVEEAAFSLVFATLGLPTEPDAELVPTVIAGQARGIVALWLASRGLDAERARKLATSAAPESSDSFDRGSLELGDCAIPSVVWSGQDLAAARAVLSLPEAETARVIRDGWSRWSNPRTGTDELLAALGLPNVGPFDHVVARPGNPC